MPEKFFVMGLYTRLTWGIYKVSWGHAHYYEVLSFAPTSFGGYLMYERTISWIVPVNICY